MNDLSIESAVFGGISMGSGISLNMTINHPERVKALVLVRPAWLDKGHPMNLDILLKVADHIQPYRKEQFEVTQAYQNMQQTIPGAANSVIGLFSRKQLDAVPVILRNMVMDKPFEHLDQLKQINVPCIIIANDDDPLHPYEMSEVIHQYIPNSRLHKVTSRYIDDAQHRTEVYEITSSFLREIGVGH